MRVLNISAGNLFGGVETMMLALARYQALCPGLEQEFAVCFEGRFSRELAVLGAPVHILGNVRVRRPASVWLARRRLRDLLGRKSFDAVICHMAWSQAIFGPVVREMGVPLVLWHHDPGPGRNWLDRWARLTRPDLAICNSAFTAAGLIRRYPGLRTEVIYCPVAQWEPDRSAALRDAARDKLETSRDDVVILQVSRMEEWKGQRQHLEALGRLRDVPGWICWQVGAAQRPGELTYLEELKRAAASLGIADRVHFLGGRYQADLHRLFNAADVFCQPNTGPEGFGITFVEALYARLPVVTTSIGPAREVVGDSCGILVPPRDASALAAALRLLIENPALRTRLGCNGPARAAALCDPARQMYRLKTVLCEIGAQGTGSVASPALFCGGG